MNIKRISGYLFIIIAFILLFIDIFQKLEYSPDDTFIYLQYARNIASGNGFAFNPGEPSYGVTSPVWVLLLTIPYFLGLDGFWFAKLLDLICGLLSIAVFFRLTGIFFKKENLLRYLATAVFIVNPWFIRWIFTGMETSFAVLLAVAVFYMFYTRKYGMLFSLLGIFYLTRPESAVLTLILFILVVYKAITEKNFNIVKFTKYIFLFGATVIPFIFFAKYSFGTMLPNTALGKSTLTITVSVILTQLREILKTLAGSSITEIILTLIFIFTAARRKNFENTAPLLLWIGGLIILYTVTDADIISRYFLIITPFLIITGLKALENIEKRQLQILTGVFLVCLLYSQFVFYKFVKPSTDDFTKGVNECFIPLGKWLNENTLPDSRILVNDVGAIGYYSNRHIIDAAALVNRDMELNRQIMSTPVEDRMYPYKLLKFADADYVIERDISENNNLRQFELYNFDLKIMKKFPSLGIRDLSPRYYKLYRVTKK